MKGRVCVQNLYRVGCRGLARKEVFFFAETVRNTFPYLALPKNALLLQLIRTLYYLLSFITTNTRINRCFVLKKSCFEYPPALLRFARSRHIPRLTKQSPVCFLWRIILLVSHCLGTHKETGNIADTLQL